MEDDNDLSSTVIAKSDQINSDELIEPIIITVTRVDKVKSKDQPVNVHSAGRQPFKPCLTMRRMLISAWGKYKDEWVGRTMTLYCDPEVLWAGKAHGGVRVSHVSNIDKPVSLMLAVASGRKKLFTLLPMESETPALDDTQAAPPPQQGAYQQHQGQTPHQQQAPQNYQQPQQGGYRR